MLLRDMLSVIILEALPRAPELAHVSANELDNPDIEYRIFLSVDALSTVLSTVGFRSPTGSLPDILATHLTRKLNRTVTKVVEPTTEREGTCRPGGVPLERCEFISVAWLYPEVTMTDLMDLLGDMPLPTTSPFKVEKRQIEEDTCMVVVTGGESGRPLQKVSMSGQLTFLCCWLVTQFCTVQQLHADMEEEEVVVGLGGPHYLGRHFMAAMGPDPPDDRILQQPSRAIRQKLTQDPRNLLKPVAHSTSSQVSTTGTWG